MSQRIKPDRPIWPPLPETGAPTVPAPGPAEAPGGAALHGPAGPGSTAAQGQRIAPATAETFGSLAG